MSRNFMELLNVKRAEDKFVCVGLDSEWGKLPEAIRLKHSNNYIQATLDFNCSIVDATAKVAGAFKINAAFYEAHGEEGWRVLRSTIAHIIKVNQAQVPVILDAKRGDIGNSTAGYLEMLDWTGADAMTVNPYMGEDALQPLLARPDKGIFILCRTSNPGAAKIQDRIVILSLPELQELFPDAKQLEYMKMACEFTADNYSLPLYQVIAAQVTNQWNKNGNCALVMGATCPEQLAAVRELVHRMLILVPGYGAQGGDLEKSLTAGFDDRQEGVLINASRSIIFASNGTDYAAAAGREMQKLHNQITQFRQKGRVA